MPKRKTYYCHGTTAKGKPCIYKARKDGYCNWHHPDAVERRRVEREATTKEGIGKCQKN